MKRKVFSIIIVSLAIYQISLASICYELSGSGQTLTVKLVSNSDYSGVFANWTTGQFTLSWQESLGAGVIDDFNQLSAFTYEPDGPVKLINGKYFQKFGFTTDVNQSFNNGSSISILSLSVSDLGTFEIDESPPSEVENGDAAMINFFSDQFQNFGCATAVDLSALPLELLAFSVVRDGNDALLSWKTALAQGVSHFNVERSLDGMRFSVFGKVNAINSLEELVYSFEDKGIDKLFSPVIYYRLHIIDFDGYTEYSPVRSISFIGSSNLQVHVFPNPTAGRSDLSIRLQGVVPEGAVELRLFDTTGRLVLRRRLGEGAAQQFTLPLPPALAPAVYWLKIYTGDRVLDTRRVVLME